MNILGSVLSIFYLELDAESIPSRLSNLILNKTGLQSIPDKVFGNHTINSITIENNHNLLAINKEAFMNVDNLRFLTLRQNRELNWDNTRGSLFYLFRNLTGLRQLILEANNINARGGYDVCVCASKKSFSFIKE